MKIRMIDRILIAIAGLLVLVLGLAMIAVFSKLLPVGGVVGTFAASLPLWATIAFIAGGVVLVALGVHGIWILFKHTNLKKYVKQETNDGKFTIALKVLESLARKCGESHKDITVKRVDIDKADSGNILVDMKVFVAGGTNIPEAIGKLQKHVRQYVYDCTGVVVDGVTVQIETDPNHQGYVPAMLPAGKEQTAEEAPAREEPGTEAPNPESTAAAEAPAEMPAAAEPDQPSAMPAEAAEAKAETAVEAESGEKQAENSTL